LPVVVYLQNLATARTGMERDEVILQDFRAEGNLVVTLTLANCAMISARRSCSANTSSTKRISSLCRKAVG
jgi:hypothetical protein